MKAKISFMEFLYNEDGQSLVEYGIIVSFFILLVVSSVELFGKSVRLLYEGILTKIVEFL